MNYKKLLYILIVLSFTSCKTADNVAYFQNINNVTSGQLTDQSINYETKISPDDQLSIFVSSIDPAAVAMFNLPLVSYQSAAETEITSAPSLQTYIVDQNGNIEFPVIGEVNVVGLTRSELAALLKEKISLYAKAPLVNVKITNFKISVLGEVNQPGTQIVPTERVTVLDAIGLAGDMTIYGKRDNVLIIRDNNGKKEFVRLDLTSSDLFTSPYYYLQQNDVVYIEPNDARKGNAKFSQNAQFNISLASTIIGAISVIASLTIALLVK